MEILIELLIDLLLDGSIELTSNKKVPKFIRYPLITIIVLFFLIIILGLCIIGILLFNKNIYASLLIIIIDIILLIGSIIKFRKIYFNKTSK